GLQWRNVIAKNWNVHLIAHATLSNYENQPDTKFSGAAEFRYRGSFPSGFSLDGSGYDSDGYFPGSRKGTLSLTQGASKRLSEKIHISGSIGYNRTAPKSYAYNYAYRSENSYGSLMLSLPQLRRISSSLSYRHQGERSPSYTSWL